ncbi:hypothetical protein GGR53DRAFT_526714 [Hypoxylon sp. FL1150]|nr:hypothetical protein GGR53DRAFT_526714 [Hypoxylon sp. FL1150]
MGFKPANTFFVSSDAETEARPCQLPDLEPLGPDDLYITKTGVAITVHPPTPPPFPLSPPPPRSASGRAARTATKKPEEPNKLHRHSTPPPSPRPSRKRKRSIHTIPDLDSDLPSSSSTNSSPPTKRQVLPLDPPNSSPLRTCYGYAFASFPPDLHPDVFALRRAWTRLGRAAGLERELASMPLGQKQRELDLLFDTRWARYLEACAEDQRRLPLRDLIDVAKTWVSVKIEIRKVCRGMEEGCVDEQVG